MARRGGEDQAAVEDQEEGGDVTNEAPSKAIQARARIASAMRRQYPDIPGECSLCRSKLTGLRKQRFCSDTCRPCHLASERLSGDAYWSWFNAKRAAT